MPTTAVDPNDIVLKSFVLPTRDAFLSHNMRILRKRHSQGLELPSDFDDKSNQRSNRDNSLQINGYKFLQDSLQSPKYNQNTTAVTTADPIEDQRTERKKRILLAKKNF